MRRLEYDVADLQHSLHGFLAWATFVARRRNPLRTLWAVRDRRDRGPLDSKALSRADAKWTPRTKRQTALQRPAINHCHL
jgi:hypothetical protein